MFCLHFTWLKLNIIAGNTAYILSTYTRICGSSAGLCISVERTVPESQDCMFDSCQRTQCCIFHNRSWSGIKRIYISSLGLIISSNIQFQSSEVQKNLSSRLKYMHCDRATIRSLVKISRLTLFNPLCISSMRKT